MDIKLLLALYQLLSTALAYNILCIFPVPSRSHDILGRGIVNALLKAGHKVTWATPYLDNKARENLTLLDVSETLRFQQGLSDIDDAQRFTDVFKVKQFATSVAKITIMNKNVRATLAKDNYDAVISEWFFSDPYAGLAAVQQVPWIVFSSVSMHPYLEYLVDEVRSATILPMMITEYPIPMSFYQRVTTSFLGFMLYAESMFNLAETTNTYELLSPLAAARNVTLPPFMEAIHNVSILFLNSHTAYAPAQSLPPNVVAIGGFHIDENIPALPKDLQELLDSSKGVVYFSMGSVMKSSTMTQKKVKELLQVFGELPCTVLWKFEDKIDALPKNVYVRTWFPQLSILAHPNVKLFITHGGLLSILEAIYCGVPLLTIPIYGDQGANAMRATDMGFARRLTYSENLARDLRVDVKTMLKNESYYHRAQHLSKLFRNQPVAPSKLISYYVELAIESSGARHLRSKAQLYPWYQRWMVDQILLLLVIIYVLYKIIYVLIRFVTKFVVSKTRETKPKRS